MLDYRARDRWHEFCALNAGYDPDAAFQAWYFGNTLEMANELLSLVISGKKTATASLVSVNEIETHNAPIMGGFSVVTDFVGDPRCIIVTSEITHVPFRDVGAEFAKDEGEGDLSLDHWRRVHWEYFSEESQRHRIAFDEDSLVCCERFELLYSR
jgi:uncharacterized protein YhfF